MDVTIEAIALNFLSVAGGSPFLLAVLADNPSEWKSALVSIPPMHSFGLTQPKAASIISTPRPLCHHDRLLTAHASNCLACSFQASEVSRSFIRAISPI
jgi:hypothetical protein